ncbi:MAG: tetratricopeptide repeat protein [Bradymonadaceae bacterium]|nr:tetratricopeptide repeat protein [Lujinxingiaceae bacterium]
MISRKSIKMTLGLSLLMLTVGFGSSALAQDVSKGKQTRSTTDKALEEASKRVEGQSKRLDTRKDSGETLPTESQFTLEQAQDESRKLSAEQIDQLKRQLEGKNRGMIAKLDQIIASDPYNAQKPNWLFQKAELLFELRNMEYLRTRAAYNQCLDASERGTSGAGCVEPEPDYTEAQTIYEEILRQYPDYNRLDEVIYRLGRGLIDAGKGAQAVGYLQRLVTNYPNSKYLPETHLALGEFFFEQQMTGAAKDNYVKVLNYKNFADYDYALYKLGWVHYNLGDFRDSVETFKAVVERTSQTLGFQRQAINDLVVAFAEIDNGWQEARDYFFKHKDKEFTYDKLGAMAGLLEAQGKEPQAIEIYEWFITERPNHGRIPDWMESIIVSKKKLEDFADLEKTMTRFVAYLGPKGTWATHNKDAEGPTNNARLLTEATLAFLSNHYHRQAQRLENKADYQTAAKYYHQFIDRFPESALSFDMTFFLAEIYLYNLNDFEKAANQYQLVVDLYKNDRVPKGAKQEEIDAIVKDSAFAVVTAFNELVKQHHEDSILVKMSQMEERSPGRTQVQQASPSAEQPPIPKTALLKYELGFVTASDQYASMFPKEDITPTVDFVAAEVYKSRGHYDSCVPRYENIITYAPKHRYASFAGNSLLEANYRLQRWDEVEKWARHLLDQKIFDVTPRDSLTSAIAYAINQRAINLKDGKEFDKAAKELLRLADEFPKSDLAAGALFNAAAIYEAGDEVPKAVEIYERLVKSYPKDKLAPEALFVMGAIFESRADFDRAASYFERLGTPDYRESERTADALNNAGVLREALQQWDNAIGTYESYLKLFPDRENVLEVELQLAYLEKERKSWPNAVKRFENFLKKTSTTKPQQVEINLELGLLAERLKPKNWEKTSDAHFAKSVEVWRALPEEDKPKTRHYAAEARFRQGEVIYERFTKVHLAFPMNRLTRSLQEKGELQQQAENIYGEVISMASPRWVAASAYRIGHSYKNFAEELYALPLPEGLPEDQEDEYRGTLDDFAFPLQERALAAFQAALKLALQFQAYNEWSSLSAQEISKLEAEKFPITGQDGVAAEHGRVNYFQPSPVKSMDVVIKRAKSRKERNAPKEAPALEEEQPVASDSKS